MAADAGVRIRAVALAFVVALVTLAGGAAQGPTDFAGLEPGRHVYDETGSSLDALEVADLDRQIADIAAETGASVVVYVRTLDATPDETLDQVEALQQAWVAATGASQDTAVAILINRDPDDPNEARAGIFVGKTYNEGNVPEGEQRAIVEDELIPPLRDGNVFGSFSAALTRLEESILYGPPKSAFEKWSERVADSWFPWVNAAGAVVGAALAAMLFRQRQRLDRPDLTPTTVRPGDLTPALAGALVAGGPQASSFPATLLDLAGRGALRIEPESEGGVFSQPKVLVRLRNSEVVADEVEAVAWRQLEKKATLGVVSSKDLARIGANGKDLRAALDSQMTAAGWKNPRAGSRKGWLALILVVAAALAVFNTIVAVSGDAWLAAIGVIAWAALAIAALVMLLRFSSLSLAGQEAALPWKAYRAGLEAVAKDQTMHLDLDTVLPDVVAMNLGTAMDKRLKDAAEAGIGLRIFQSTVEGGSSYPAIFPYWLAFNSSVIAPSSSGSGAGTVSGGGAGGGGGAAGST